MTTASVPIAKSQRPNIPMNNMLIGNVIVVLRRCVAFHARRAITTIYIHQGMMCKKFSIPKSIVRIPLEILSKVGAKA